MDILLEFFYQKNKVQKKIFAKVVEYLVLSQVFLDF
jgi:hypothetical protein